MIAAAAAKASGFDIGGSYQAASFCDVAVFFHMNLQSSDFELFDLPTQFAQDCLAIDARWKALQRQVHPDRFAGDGAAAQRVALQWSVRINEAYRRLKDPIQRASYLCQLNGRSVGAEDNTAMPTDFLVQQIEWREALDDATDSDSLQAVGDLALAAQNGYLDALAESLDRQQNYDAAISHIRALMFIDRFRGDVVKRTDLI